MQADGKFSFMINLISLYSLWKYWPLTRDHETVCLVNVNTNSNNFNIFNISQITAFGLDGTGSFKANSDDGFFFSIFLMYTAKYWHNKYGRNNSEDLILVLIVVSSLKLYR